MRHFKTPAGEVHELRFAPDGGSMYFLARNPMDWSRIRALLAADPYNLVEMTNVSSVREYPGLYCRAYRIDTRSGEITGDWSIDGSDNAIFTLDLRSVYHSVSVAVAGGDFDLHQTDLATGNSTRIRDLNVRGLECMALTPNGHILAAGGLYEHVRRLDVWHNVELEPIPTEARCVAYSPDGRLLATGNSDGVQVWDGRRSVARWAGEAWRLAWSSDGRLASGRMETMSIACPGDSEPRSWNVAHGHLRVLAFSACGRFLATGNEHGMCSVHDPATGTVRATFNWGIGRVHSVAFSPDGLTCAAGGENGQVVVWDVDS